MSSIGNPAIALALPAHPGRSTALAQRLLNVVLFITVAMSAIAVIEPSPHDALMFALLVICVAARVPFDRLLVPLLILLLFWCAGGFLALVHVGDQENAIQYVGTSLYLDIATLMFACLTCTGDLRRLATIHRAYVLAAIIATTAGYIGFFHLTSGSDFFLLDGGRVRATFKDPNVYAPFLIFPLLVLIINALTRSIKMGNLAVIAFLLGGLLLSFSRGAWIHFALSAAVCFAIVFAAAPDPRMRARIVGLGIVATIFMALLIVALVSVDSVHDLFVERAKAIQPYDVGPGGRFTDQLIALGQILQHPSGLGPFEFSRIFGMQQHNVYLQGFLVYGWLGGMTYLTLIAVTVMVGLNTAFTRTPWQPYLIAAFGAFIGEAGEGLIVDTDHWRHFFLILGLVWGLAAATINYRRQIVSRNHEFGVPVQA